MKKMSWIDTQLCCGLASNEFGHTKFECKGDPLNPEEAKQHEKATESHLVSSQR